MRSLCLSLFLTLAALFVVPADGFATAQTSKEEVAKPAADANFQLPAQEVVGMAKPGQLWYQEGVTPSKEGINAISVYVHWLAFGITVFVMLLLGYVCIRFCAKRNPVASKVSHNTLVEVVWTVVPILILITIAIPTLRLHYGTIHNLDEADMTLKVTGHQWYWSYEYPDEGIAFDSNLKKKEELAEGEPYLLAVDNPVVVPVNKKVRVQLTGADVIHSWAVPSFGVKTDTVPGRLNETWFMAEKEGIYYGQCSELCGKFHGFMPIQVHVVSDEVYAQWVASAKLKFAQNRYGTTDMASK